MADLSEQLDNLILSIHQGCLTNDGWKRIANTMCAVLGADGASLAKPVLKPGLQSWCSFINLDPTFMRDYQIYWGQHDEWFQGAIRLNRLGVGLVNIDDQLLDHRRLKKLAFYNDFLKPVGIERMMNITLSAEEPDGKFGNTAMSFYRRPGNGSFSNDQANILNYLAPHLVIAAQNYWAAQSMQLMSTMRDIALNNLTSAVFAIEEWGRIVFSNQLAETFLHCERWVRLSHKKLLPSRTVVNANVFTRAVQQGFAGIGSKFILTEAVTGVQAVVSIVSMSKQENAGLFQMPLSILVWVTPVSSKCDLAQDLTRLFGLTPAEIRLIEKLAKNYILRDAADVLTISLHTARTQLKSVFRKVGVHTQAQLLALFARL